MARKKKDVVDVKCPNCTGPLHFVIETGRLECDYCGASFAPEELEARTHLTEASAPAPAPEERSTLTALEAHLGDSVEGWDTSDLDEDWGDEEAQLRAFNCPSCGAELFCGEKDSLAQCPYCGNNGVVESDFTGDLRPDYVIPFKHTKAEAMAALKKHYRKKRLLPRKFSSRNELEKIQGVYVPFFLFDATVEAKVLMDGMKEKVKTRGDKEITTIKHHDVRREGTVEFRMVPEDASKRMPDALMDSLLPYDYSGIKDFSLSYLAGVSANKYDVSVQDCAKRADKECAKSVEETFRQDARKSKEHYTGVAVKDGKYNIHRGKVHYALLPVWMLHTDWQGKKLTFAMNGQTGKFVGDLPVGKGKLWGSFFAMTGLFGLLGYILSVLGA